MGIALAQRISGALSEEIATAERRLAELQQEVGAAWAAANKPYTCPDCGRMFTAAGMADHRDDGPCEPYKADESAEEVTEVP
jgi:hypothetical protein